MHEQSLKVLLIEDDPDHAKLIRHHLAGVTDHRIDLEWVDRLSAGLERLAGDSIDAVLADLGLTDSESSSTLPRILAQNPDVPVIVLTALADQDVAVKAVQEGAQDYLVKDRITGDSLVRSIRYAIERKRTHTNLQHYAAELERSNREFQEFAHIVAHDLKTPLWIVSYCCDLLQKNYRQQVDEETAEFIDSAVAAVKGMYRMIDDLLAYARVGSRGNPFEPTDCQEVLDQAIAHLQAVIAESDAEITHDPLPTIEADATQLAMVFQNLIGNALKYRSEEPPKVHVSARREDGHWLFSVQDNGIGIEPEYAEQIFVIFERLHSDEKYSGTGIGLAISKRIVQRHGGRIWVESQPGQGSTFYFTLPAVHERGMS